MVNVISEVSKDKIFDLLNHGNRIDNRAFNEYRDISIKTNYITKADGSALVSLNGTTVVAGVKTSVATPFSNAPNQGILITNTELLAIANRNFEYGPPNKFAIEISRVVDRAIREAPLIDLNELCIVESSKVWKIHLDLHIIDHDGDLLDAVCLAAVCALMTTKIPTAISVNGEITLDYDKMINLPIKNKTIICSVYNVNDYLLVDPIYVEETLMNYSVSIGFREDGSLCAMQKCGFSSVSPEELLKIIKIGSIQSKKLFELLESIK
ncbi:MAG: exosome complex protein Rrp42 [Methanosphaera sp.]|nr:exosome complex protein Rrp42 [Methanosphaera sp.]